MRPARILLTACLLLIAGFAGCLSDQNGNQTPSQAADASGSTEASNTSPTAPASTMYRFGPANGSEQLALNGTFGPTDSCLFSACPSGPTTESLPITETLTEGQPVQVNATLTWEPSGPGNIGLDLQRSDVKVLSPDWSITGASVTFTGILIQKPGGEASFQVSYQNPESPSDVTYTLTVETSTLNTQIPAETPTLVTVPAPASALSITPSDTARTLRVWTPMDAYLGEITLEDGETTLSLPGTGDYVLLATADSGPVQLAAANTSAPLDPLELLDVEVVYGEGTSLSPEGSATFEFEPDPIPVRVGLYYQPPQTQTGALAAEANEQGSISSPNGTLFSFGSDQSMSFSAGGAGTWISSASIQPGGGGTWTGSYSADIVTPGEVGPLLVQYQRPG